ncbi:hypothetical protein GE09DRAFT_1254311 [Coniochaeta sp. 2T2.1]|nr:hypothetical protein GE09DRAFT_1254311 [Coniochaeta sp. 2T2.1]
MGLLDDAASMVSGRSSHSHSHSKHKSSSSHSKHHSKHRSRSRSSSRSRHHNRSSSHLPGIAASLFGVTEDKHHHKSDKHHSSSRSIFGGDDKHSKHNSSRASVFGLGSSHGNASRSSFFGFGQRTPSYYKRSPRPSFIQRSLKQVKRLLRDLVYYAKRHPLKVFALVIMPLVTGGFLTALLARFGLRLPAGLERMLGVAVKAGAGDGIGLVGEAVRMASGGFGGGSAKVSVERGRDGGMSWERRRVEREDDGGWGGAASGLMGGVAKMFI